FGPARQAAAGESLPVKVVKLPGFSVATFEGWRVVPVIEGKGGAWVYDTVPPGRESDFVLRLAIVTPSARDLAQIFNLGPRQLQQRFPFLKRVGEPERCTFAGDEARRERYEGQTQGKQVAAHAVYLKKKDVAVGVVGMGSPAGVKE